MCICMYVHIRINYNDTWLHYASMPLENTTLHVLYIHVCVYACMCICMYVHIRINYNDTWFQYASREHHSTCTVYTCMCICMYVYIHVYTVSI